MTAHSLPEPDTYHADPLTIRNLAVAYRTRSATVNAVRGVDLTVVAGGSLGIVGESGCGKSTLVSAIAGLLPDAAEITADEASFGSLDLLDPQSRQHAMGLRIGYIFQNPGVALNPVLTIGRQLTDHLRTRLAMSKRQAYERAEELLVEVGISEPKRRLDSYPHEFSGGMLQRVMIAIALGCNPDLLIADEPTTALDATIQAEIVDLIGRLQRSRGLTLIWITHDLSLLRAVTQDVAVMYAGRVVEQGRLTDVFSNPQHPYSKALLSCVQSLWADERSPLSTIPGAPPDLRAELVECAYRPRCPQAFEPCAKAPVLIPARSDPSHCVACHAVRRAA